jgi:histidinol dehydrogenase
VGEAKRQLAGIVGIDMIAGPTEVVVIADESADPRYVAADLIAQAEHDEDATAWLITPSEGLAKLVEDELEPRLEATSRREIARRSLERNGCIVLVPDVKVAIEVANRRAPEHLELLIREARSWVDQVRHAGAVFVGPATPEPVGDYIAGPSHVLPTSGTARFASGLGVHDFVRRMSIIEYSAQKLELDARVIISLAEIEGFTGHAEAVRVRLERES